MFNLLQAHDHHSLSVHQHQHQQVHEYQQHQIYCVIISIDKGLFTVQ